MVFGRSPQKLKTLFFALSVHIFEVTNTNKSSGNAVVTGMLDY